MRFEELLERQERGEPGQLEAAEMLGTGERTFRRWRDRLRDEGEEGLLDRRIGKPSPRRAPESELARALYEEMYGGFTVKHFHEKLVKRHGYKLGYRVTRLALRRAGPVRPAKRRGAHRGQAPSAPDGRHDAASGRLDAPLAPGPAGLGPGRHDGRCDERDPFGLSGGAGRDRVELPRSCRDDFQAWPVPPASGLGLPASGPGLSASLRARQGPPARVPGWRRGAVPGAASHRRFRT